MELLWKLPVIAIAGYLLGNIPVSYTHLDVYKRQVVYWGNRLSGKPLGLWIAAGFVMLDTTIYNILPASLQRYSPLSLSLIHI